MGGGWCAKSFLRLTQLKVMLGWIEVELGFSQYGFPYAAMDNMGLFINEIDVNK